MFDLSHTINENHSLVNLSVLPLFPNPVLMSTITNDSEILTRMCNICYNLKEKDPIGESKSNRGGWHSSASAMLQPESTELLNFLLESVNSTMTLGFGYTTQHVIKLVSCWINISGKGNYHQTHTHMGSHFSGILYLKYSDGHGKTVFRNDDVRDFETYTYPKEVKDYLHVHNIFTVDPSAGNMVIFPSSLPHFVESNEIEEDRISISFNVVIATK